MTINSLPKIGSYGNYSSSNYGVHTKYIDLKNITLYYSYETIVAYEDIQDGLIVHKNIWGVTTGKHLNWINDDHSIRLDSADFDEMLVKACERHGI